MKFSVKFYLMAVSAIAVSACGSGSSPEDAQVHTGALHHQPVNAQCNDSWNTPLKKLVGQYSGTMNVRQQSGIYASQRYSMKLSQCAARVMDESGQSREMIFLHTNIVSDGSGPLGSFNTSAYLGYVGYSRDGAYEVYHSHPVDPNPFKAIPIKFVIAAPVSSQSRTIIQMADCTIVEPEYATEEESSVECNTLSEDIQFNDDLVKR